MLAVTVLLVTLFFGLKPKGFRFFNQVKRLDGETGILFYNIGSVHGEKRLEEIGISDTMCIIMKLSSNLPRRGLMRIASVVGRGGHELVTIDQWKNGIEVSLWNKAHRRRMVVKKSDVFQKDSASIIAVNVVGTTVEILGDSMHAAKKFVEDDTFLYAFPGSGQLLLGLSSTGRNPWRGSMYGLALYKRAVTAAEMNETNRRLAEGRPFGSTVPPMATALFDFSEQSGRFVYDHSGNGWNLVISAYPKIFRYDMPEVIPNFRNLHKRRMRRSMAFDTIINFIGFLPFGCCFFLFFSIFAQTGRRAVFITMICAVVVSAGIEFFQIFIPTRSPQLIDIVLNVSAAWTGAVTVKKLRKKNRD